MSSRYLPSMILRSGAAISGFTLNSIILKSVIPDSGCANEICVFTERGQGKFCFVEGNQRAALADDLFDAAEKQGRTFHDAAAEHDGIGAKHSHEIGQAEAEIVGFTIHGPPGDVVAGRSQLADSLGG